MYYLKLSSATSINFFFFVRTRNSFRLEFFKFQEYEFTADLLHRTKRYVAKTVFYIYK